MVEVVFDSNYAGYLTNNGMVLTADSPSIRGVVKQLAGAIGQHGGTLVTTINTSALPYTTKATDGTVVLTGSTASGTLTLGTVGFLPGQQQRVVNESSVTVTLAAHSGSVDTTSLAAASNVIMFFDGTNWKTLGTNAGGGGGSGTVTSASVVSANGFAGTVATATTTPAITLTTTVAAGLVKSSGTALSAATAGTDYLAGTSGAATGLVVSTTGTGALATVAAPVGTVLGTTDTQTVTNKRITKRVYSATAPGATPMSAVSTDSYDVISLSACATAITSMTPTSSTPAAGDTIRFQINDNGTAQAITWGSSYVAASELPTATLGSSTGILYVAFYWNGTKWACVGGTPGPALVQQDPSNWAQTANTNFNLAVAGTVYTIFNPVLGIGTWHITGVMGFGLTATTAGMRAAVGMQSGSGYTVLTPTGSGYSGSSWRTPTNTISDNLTTLPLDFYVLVTAAATTVAIVASCDTTAGVDVLYQGGGVLSGLLISYCNCALVG